MPFFQKKKKCTNRRVQNENQYEIDLEREIIFSSRVRFHIFTSQSHFIPEATDPSCLRTNTKSEGSGNVTCMEFKNRTRTQVHTRCTISRSLRNMTRSLVFFFTPKKRFMSTVSGKFPLRSRSCTLKRTKYSTKELETFSFI